MFIGGSIALGVIIRFDDFKKNFNEYRDNNALIVKKIFVFKKIRLRFRLYAILGLFKIFYILNGFDVNYFVLNIRCIVKFKREGATKPGIFIIIIFLYLSGFEDGTNKSLIIRNKLGIFINT